MSSPPRASFNLPNLEIVNLLGRGGMSSVWRARQVSLDRFVAVKILSKDFSSSAEDIARFRQEACACARLQHSGIMRVYDANFCDGVYYIIMELIDGYTMGEWLRRRNCLPVDDALIAMESVAYALDYAWTTYAMVHCDLKPDNVMVDADGTIKVTDLGLARSILAMHGGSQDEVLGTPGYMSPEQAYAEPHLDCRSDIYSLGATLYHLLTGQMLFEGLSGSESMLAHVGEAQAPDIQVLRPDVTHGLAVMLERMLAKRREHRYSDWKALLADISLVYNGHCPPKMLLPAKGSSMVCGRKMI